MTRTHHHPSGFPTGSGHLPWCGGDVLAGTYRIVRRVADGGMGSLFEAEHLTQRRRVAIKWLRASRDARLVREGMAAMRARHPNVVEVFDILWENGEAFLVMELLHGESLSNLFKRGPLEASELLPLLLPAMRAMASAHARGVLHRDISPANLFVASRPGSSERTLKILDFGLAKLKGTTLDGDHDARPGCTWGTPMYMSREQVLDFDDVDERTDVYGFGAVLYEGLTGRTPFQADGLAELILKVLTETPPPLRSENPSVSRELEQIVMLTLQKDREWRLRSMDALVRALEGVVSGSGTNRAGEAPAEEVDAPHSRRCGPVGARPPSAVQAPTRMVPTPPSGLDLALAARGATTMSYASP